MAKKKAKLSKSYFDFLKQSFVDAKNNPVVFVPLLFGFAVSLLLSMGQWLFIYGGKGNVFFYAQQYPLTGIDMFTGKFIFIFIIMSIVAIILSIYFGAMLIGVCRDIVTKGKSSFKSMLDYGRMYFMNILLVSLLLIFVFVIPAVIVLGIIIALLGLLATAGGIAAAVSGLVILAILVAFLAAVLVFLAFVIFLQPIISDSRTLSPWKTILAALSYSKKNFGKAISTLLWVILFGIVFAALNIVLMLLFGIPLFTAGADFNVGLAQMILFEIISIPLGLIFNAVLALFIFNVYFKKNSLFRSAKR